MSVPSRVFGLRFTSEGAGIYRLDSFVASEVTSVEGENLGDAMRLRRGRKPCVVDFDAGDTVRNNQLSARMVRCCGVRHDIEIGFEELRMPFRTGGAHAKAVVIGGASANVPEFPDVLRCKAKTAAIPAQTLQRFPSVWAESIAMLNGPEQNVGINEYGNWLRSYHRSVYQFSRLNASSVRTGLLGKLSSHSSNSFSH